MLCTYRRGIDCRFPRRMMNENIEQTCKLCLTIEDRIRFHEIMRRKYNDEKDKLEERLNRYNEKITYHMLAIINLEKKRGDF